MGKCCPGTHETFTHDGYMSPMMGICRHGYMSHGYMSPNPCSPIRDSTNVNSPLGGSPNRGGPKIFSQGGEELWAEEGRYVFG